jgi:ubiquitin-conjugating enzyme E2 M
VQQPNPDDPLNKEVAALMLDNRVQFERNVKQSLQGGYVAGRQFPKLLK